MLAFVYGRLNIKIAIVSATQVQKSDFINFARLGSLLFEKNFSSYVLRAIYPTIATISAVFFRVPHWRSCVAVQQVFSWGGFGQYAVQSVVKFLIFRRNSGCCDRFLVTEVLFSQYIVVDMILIFSADPRIKELG